MIRRGRRSSFPWIRGLLGLAVLVWLGDYGYQKAFTFNSQEIVDNSELSNNTFEVKAEEIASPKYGIKAYLYQDKTNPIISMSFIFKNAGMASDDEDKSGLASLTGSMLGYGAGKYDAEGFTEELENKAISLGFSANLDDFTGSLLTTKDNQDKAYELLKMVLVEPRFDKDSLNQVKARMLTALRQQRERPESILALEFMKEVYKNHPYARNSLGNEEDIKKIKADDLRNYVQNYLTRNNLVVGVAGDITPDELGKVLDEVFGSLPQSGSNNFIREAEVDFPYRNKNVDFVSAQNVAVFIGKGVERNHPDFYPLYVANYVLGGAGLNSRLNIMAREKEGLSYGISTYLGLADKSPTINGSFSATPENFDRLTGLLKDEMNNFGVNGMSEKDLADAKNYLISSYNLRFAAIGDIADIMAYMQRDNLGLDFLQKRNDYVREVKLEDVNRVAKEYFDTDKMIFMNIGNFEKKN